MLVGLTYDLKDDYLKIGFSEEEVAEFDNNETIAGIENALSFNGYKTERIGRLENVMKALLDGKRWDIVFNIAEGFTGIGREAQIPVLLEAFEIPYVFSDSMLLSLTLHKGMTKRIIRDGGIKTADFNIISNISELKNLMLPFPLFVKPVSEGTGKGISNSSIVTNIKQLKDICEELIKKFNQSVIVETFLTGREFTVGITGTGNDAEILGVMEIIFKDRKENNIYGLYNKKNYIELIDYIIPEQELCNQCSDIALQAWKILGCRDGGRIDLRYDSNGYPNFLEVNPLAGLNPVDSDLPILSRLYGVDYNSLIGKIMKSALMRIEKY